MKLPFTSAASTKGLHRYNGFDGVVTTGDGGVISVGEKVPLVGVGERFARGARAIERLQR